MVADENKNPEPDNIRESLRQRMGADESDARDPEGGQRKNVQTLVPEDKPEPKKSGVEKINFNIALTGPGLVQMMAFCRQLSTLVEVGIPLVQSLGILADRVQHPKLRKVVRDVARRVEEGSSFTDALRAHPRIFSPLVINVVSVGESAGILEGALKYLADTMERKADLRRKVMGAAAYPAVALTVCLVVLIVVLNVSIPTFAEVYTQSGNADKLPQITQNMIALSEFVQAYWVPMIILLVVAIVGLRLCIRFIPAVRYAWDWLMLKMFIVKLVAVKANVARTTRTLSNLLHAGIPLLESLRITAESSENVVVAKALVETHNVIEGGGRIDEPLRKAKVFPDIVVDMVSIGDEAGRLDIMFEKIANTYDSDLDQTVRTLNALLEPVMIVIMGVIVLLVALSVLLPIWTMGDAIF